MPNTQPRFPVFTWFVPLEDPLNLPEGYIAKFTEPRTTGDMCRTEEGWHPVYRSTEAIISLKVWHVPNKFAGVLERTESAFEAGRRAFPMYFDDGHDSADMAFDIDAPTTVVELAVAIHDENPHPARLAPYFENGLAHIQRLQRAHGSVTGDPIRPVTLATLPAHLPMATASCGEFGFEPDGGLNLYLIERNFWHYLARTDFEPQQIHRFENFLHWDTGAFGGYRASYSESISALKYRGDARSSLLACATACEILLDDLFKHLLWEDGSRPEDCVKFFIKGRGTSSTLERLRKYVGPLLRADWNPEVQPVLSAWQNLVSYRRHKAIHAGWMPSEADAREALAACDALFTWCAKMICQRIARYPKTALVMVGSEQLQEQILARAELAAELQPDAAEECHSRFVRWRTCLDRLTYRHLGQLQLDTSNANLVAIAEPNGETTWVQHLADQGFAALTDPPDENENARALDSLSAITRAVEECGSPLTVLFESMSSSALQEDWVAEHRRLPDLGVMVNGLDRY